VRRRHLALAAAALLAFVPYRAFLSSDVPSGRDLLFYFYPLKAHLVEAVRAGEMPWIDRYRCGGVPLLAAPGVAAYDPGNLLFLVLPIGAAAKTWMLLRIAVGLLGFAALARRLGVSHGAAAVAGLAFALGGGTVSLVAFLSSSSAWSLLPWVAAFALDLRRAPGLAPALPLAAMGALLAFAALPEFLLYAAVIALVIVVPERRAPARPPLPRLAGAAALAALLAAGLGAVALLPPAVASLDTVRGPGGGTNIVWATQGALPLDRLPQLLSDGFGYDWAAGAPNAKVSYPYLPSITPGRVAVVLGLLGLARGGRGRLRACLLVALGLLLAVGRATPFFAAAAAVFPPLLTLRYPEKYALLALFGLALLTILGLRALEESLGERARRVALPLLALAILADRESIARRLVEMAPAHVLTRAPSVLAALPPAPPPAPPTRLFHAPSYAPVPAYDVRDLAKGTRWDRESLLPEYATLFGYGYFLELDYDYSLPREAFEWGRFLNKAVPAGGGLADRLLRSGGVAAQVVTRRRGPELGPGLGSFRDPLPPYRFASRAVFDADGRRLLGRMLDEGFEPGTAYVAAADAPKTFSVGRVLRVADRPSALTLEVEVPPRGDGVLMLYRLGVATADATLDGRPLATRDLAFGFTEVTVPPGRHVVRLRPSPRSVKIGATVTGCSLVILVALCLRRERAPGSRPE